MADIRTLPVKLRQKQAEVLIRRISEDTRNIIFGNHATDRMEERGITPNEVIQVLKKGHVYDMPVPGKKKSEWKCKVERHARGNRDIGVVTIIMQEQRLFLVIIEWEDL